MSTIYVTLRKFDLIHLHHRDAAFLIPLLKLRAPVLLTTHGIFTMNDEWMNYSWFFKFQEKYFVKKASYITCVSKTEKTKFKEFLGLDVDYIPNGVNIKSFNSQRIESSTCNYQQPYITFAAGRIIHLKGLDIALKAVKMIEPLIKVVIIGNIEIDISLKKEIMDLAKGMDTEFVGLIKNNNKLKKLIIGSQLFIFPSRRETMSMMLLEVSSLKVPIIASDIKQNKDVFDQNEVLFFKSEDIIDLSKKIEWALHHKTEMSQYAQKAYEKVSKNYNWDDISDIYKNVYNKLL